MDFLVLELELLFPLEQEYLEILLGLAGGALGLGLGWQLGLQRGHCGVHQNLE